VRELHLFAGIGGGILAGQLLGHRPVGAVEISPFCRQVLRAHWPDLPIHDDIRTFEPPAGCADVVAGGFPCQDISLAGKGRGLAGERSGLWFEMLRVVREVQPAFVFVENSPALRTRGLDTVLLGLAELGFDAEWGVLGAEAVGAPHMRRRLWILGAHPDRAGRFLEREERPEQQRGHNADGVRSDVPDAERSRPPEWQGPEGQWALTPASGSAWWAREPSLGRVVDGFPGRVDQVHALGNAQVPLQAAEAFQQLMKRYR
jgi:DNA (cytosine-5)-methyltransferase 1